MSHGAPIAHDEGDANLVGGRAQLTLRLDVGASGGGDDLAGADLSGLDLGGADLAACATVTQCMDGDGCCPAGCNNASDHDCAPVCGNNIIETGEACDDGNTVNGDGCDPTCHWANVMTTLSGVAGSTGYADGSDSRFGNFGGMTSDANNVYFSDLGSSTIRVFPLIAPNGASLFAGAPYDSRKVDGPIANARFFFGGGGGDMVIINGTLYVVDFDIGATNANILRSVTSTTVSTIAAVAQPSLLATDGTNLYYVDNNANVMKWVPGGSSPSVVALGSSIQTALGTAPFFAGMTYYNSALYLTTYHGIVKITTSGTVSLLTGSADNSRNGCANGALTGATGALYGQLGHITNDGGGNLYVADASCCAIRYVPLISGNVGTYAGTLGTCGHSDNANALMAQLSQPNNFVYRSGGMASYVLDNGNNVIRMVANGGVSTIGSGPYVHTTQTYGSAAQSRYNGVVAMVSDGTKIYAIAGSGQAGTSSNLFTVALADGSSVSMPASWMAATSITKIGTKLYVGVTDGTIHRLDVDGTGDTVVAGMVGATYPPSDGSSALSAVLDPVALTTDGTDVYFLDRAKLVRKLNVAAGTVATIAGMQGSSDVIDGVGGAAHFATPSSLVYAGGALYTLDGVVNQNMAIFAPLVVRRITLASRDVKTIAGQLTTVGNADGVGLAAQFGGAFYLATDGESLFISDADEAFQTMSKGYQPTIRQMTLADANVTTMIGKPNEWTIHNGTGSQAFVNKPGPMTFDATTHTLLFFDRNEGVIQRIR